MNDRGQYGAPSYQTPMLGMSTETKRDVAIAGFNAFTTFVMVALGSWWGGSVTPKDPKKGALIGGAAGFFANVLLGQKSALDRIADHSAGLKS